MTENSSLPNGWLTPFVGGGTESEFAGSVPAVPRAHDLEVAPDRILAVATVIEEQVDFLQHKLAQQVAALRIPAPSEDIISMHAVEAWNEVITGAEGSYEQRVRAYVQQLRDLAEQLREAGKGYAASEDEHAAVFDDQRGHGN